MLVKKLEDNLVKLKDKKILVVGDLMIDHYLWGKVDRISPEAPVPVLDVKKQESRLGGAANVVNNIFSLGGKPFILGVIGDDSYGQEMRKLLREKNISDEYLIVDASRMTTVKSRIIAHNQQIVRVDYENSQNISAEIEQHLIKIAEELIPKVDAVLIEDYNKGMLTENVIRNIIRISNEHQKVITVDPKFKNFFAYKNCTVFKPNYLELQKNLGINIETEEEFQQAALDLLQRVNPEYLIVTRGENGLVIFFKNQEMFSIPTFALEVFDGCGAGDAVISTLTLCLSAGLDIKTSAEIANHAAGVVCGKVGVVPVTANEIVESFKKFNEI